MLGYNAAVLVIAYASLAEEECCFPVLKRVSREDLQKLIIVVNDCSAIDLASRGKTQTEVRENVLQRFKEDACRQGHSNGDGHGWEFLRQIEVGTIHVTMFSPKLFLPVDSRFCI